MRPLVALLLSLILALAAQSEAVARSEMAGATDQTLCGAYGTTNVTLDATGHRIAPHPCTHCVSASVMASLVSATSLTAAPIARSHSVTLTQTAQIPVRRTFAASARAPPALLT